MRHGGINTVDLQTENVLLVVQHCSAQGEEPPAGQFVVRQCLQLVSHQFCSIDWDRDGTSALFFSSPDFALFFFPQAIKCR